MKRVIDIVVAMVALIFLFPFMLVVATVIYYHDFGPILFRQKRIGLGGRCFTLLKFRSMTIDAEQRGGY